MTASTARSIVAFLFSLSIIAGFLLLGKIDEGVFTMYATLVLGYFFGKADTKDAQPDGNEAVESLMSAQSVRNERSFVQLAAQSVSPTDGPSISAIKMPKLGAGFIRGLMALFLVGGVVWGFVTGILAVNIFVNFAATAMGYYFGKDKDHKDTANIEFAKPDKRVLGQGDIDRISKEDLLRG